MYKNIKCSEKMFEKMFRKNGKSGVSDAIETLNDSHKKTKQDILKQMPIPVANKF
jgi:predicted CopG family antitoxin